MPAQAGMTGKSISIMKLRHYQNVASLAFVAVE